MNTHPIEKIINILEVEVEPQLSYEDKLIVRNVVSSLESIVFDIKAGLSPNVDSLKQELALVSEKSIYDILGEHRI